MGYCLKKTKLAQNKGKIGIFIDFDSFDRLKSLHSFSNEVVDIQLKALQIKGERK